MNLLVDIVRINWPENINEITRANNLKVSAWLKNGDFEVRNDINNPDNFSLFNYTKSFLNVNAFEIEKMACACIETLISIEHKRVNEKSLAWIIVKLYYAAFYAAHALMRTMGYLCIHIDSETASKIEKYAQIYYINSKKPNTGYYLVYYDSNNNEIIFKRNSNSKGSHFFLWSCLLDLIDKLLIQLASSSTIYQPYIVSLSNLKDVMCLRGNTAGNWLSVIRNDVTYKHELGVWYPNLKLKKKFEKKVLRDIDLTKEITDIDLKIYPKEELLVFVNAANFLSILMIDVENDLINRNSKKKSFLKKNFIHIMDYFDPSMAFLHS